ncbi:MAG: hypothetical protein DRI90_28185 [Deltaproteobacteria bacterium]|nr:MAG: hypothetical protein DRI90_28185 [Deltaproteobacteria bacterium]
MKRTRGTQLGSQAIWLSLALVAAGCSGKDIEARQAAQAAAAQAAAQLKTIKAAISATQDELSKTETAMGHAKRELTALGAANGKLNEKPQKLFDAAVAKMDAGKDNAADQDALRGFQEVADRFPLDPLAATAVERIDELNERIQERDKKLAEDQSEVRKLVETCRASSQDARKARDAALRINAAKEIDMNAAKAAERRAATLEKKAKKAKDKAAALIESVPDPGGKLGKELEACDQAD